MKFSRTFGATVLVVIGSLVLVSAGHYGGGNGNSHGGHGYSNDDGGALTHYGGGGCHGHGCYNKQAAPAASHSSYGPYHSYAVRPAVYGGHGLYTYRGYARHHPAPAVHYRRTRSYGSGAGAMRHHGGGGCRGYNCAHHNAGASQRHGGYGATSMGYNNHRQQHQQQHYNNHHDNEMMGAYGMRPVKALALIHQNDNYEMAEPAPMMHHGGNNGGHYRAARGAYGSGRSHGHGNGNGNGYRHSMHSASAGYGASSGHHGNNNNNGGHHGGYQGGY